VMRTDEAHSPPFDEQAALEELERLRDAIEESRRQRSQRSDEFEAFVRSFRTPSAPPAGTDVVERQQAVDRQPPPPAAQQPLTVDRPLPVDQPVLLPVVESAPPPLVQSTPASKRRTRALVPRALGGAALLVASVVLLMRPWKAVRSETAASPPTGGAPITTSAPATTTPDPAAAPAPAPAPAAPAAADAHALQGELNVQRRVWVRVLLDGERAVEREVPAGTRIPLQADRAIVIRAGDAGAVRVTINGVDRGPLGKDAEIITRTFTAPR
jgi:hypothetical protein